MISALLLLTCCLSAPADVTIDTDSITLNKLIPFPASDSRGAISLGFAPNPGLARRFLKDELLARITAAGFSTDDLKLPDSILVHRLSQGLDRDRLTQVVLDAFIRQFPGGNVEIRRSTCRSSRLAPGKSIWLRAFPRIWIPRAPICVKLDVRGDNFVQNPLRPNIRADRNIAAGHHASNLRAVANSAGGCGVEADAFTGQPRRLVVTR